MYSTAICSCMCSCVLIFPPHCAAAQAKKHGTEVTGSDKDKGDVDSNSHLAVRSSRSPSKGAVEGQKLTQNLQA